MALFLPTRSRLLVYLVSLIALSYNLSDYLPNDSIPVSQRVPYNAQEILDNCRAIKAAAGPPALFAKREISDRFEPGTNSTLITNATLLTGKGNDTRVEKGDLYLHNGLIKAIGSLSRQILQSNANLTVINAMEAWVTPGLVDLHTHMGLESAPFMAGTSDVDSKHGPILPWLRSIDGLNTYDDSFQLAISGGVTSAQVVPRSTNNIGGQAFIMKFRKTSEGSPLSMLVEPPYNLNGSSMHLSSTVPWRHLHQACGEMSSRYGNRPDAMWALRSAYSEAREIVAAQDMYCAKAETGLWDSLGKFPESQQWEMLVDVLRGRVKHWLSRFPVCVTAPVDIDALVRLTNEFKFPVASLQDASEAWLIPGLLNRTTSFDILFKLFNLEINSDSSASYRGSEFAPRVLSDAGISVVMKSAHPVINSRYLLQEAQQAHYFGLPPYLALASVTSVPAAAAGLDHRLGGLHEGADADVVLWDSNPLRQGATPLYVWIDGAQQIPLPARSGRDGTVEAGVGKEGEEWSQIPAVPDWGKERKQAIEWEGLPPLAGRKQSGKVVLKNVREVWNRGPNGEILEAYSAPELVDVIVANGKIICVGKDNICLVDGMAPDDFVDLHGGSVSPGLMAFGSSLGLEEIPGESSTGDGSLFDAFTENVPRILNDPGAISSAMDALMFGTRNALNAHRAGVTIGTASLTKRSPGSATVLSGISTTFRTGSSHAMEKGAIGQASTALHVAIHRPYPVSMAGSQNHQVSVSTQIAGLRRLLYGWGDRDTETGIWFKKAAEGVVPLVIEVQSADIMATLLILKAEVENQLGSRMRMVFSGAAEAHILAKEIGRAGVGVILDTKPVVGVWDERRTLPGRPLTNDTTLVALHREGVKVGLRCREAQHAANMRFDLTWAMLAANGHIDKQEAYALLSTNLEELLGVTVDDGGGDLVAYAGGSIFEMSSKVVAILSTQRGEVDIL
ncbi:carbohydrate esterase family 9 protein [Mycena rebaudengoi]|nr:carbohydrate esterase family 9 protein [Mycena rebaudengoi]